MLHRYILLVLIIVSFSACQNNEGTANKAMGTSSETEEKTPASSSPKIKSLKDAAKQQEQFTAQKTKEAKAKTKAEEDARIKEERMKEENSEELTKMEREKKKTLKAEEKQKQMLSKENRIDLSKGSTKNRILQNIRKRQNQKSLRPSSDFQQSMRGLYDMGLELVRQDGAPISGYDRDNKAEIIDSYYAYVSPERIWGGPFKFQEGKAPKELFLQNVDVFEAIFRTKEAQNGVKPDLKITEIQFENEKAATEGLPIVEEISKGIWKKPKHINQFWQAKERIYLIQTRAASFKPVYESANKVLYFTATSSK